MNEEKSYIPTLTLEPTAEAVAEAAAPAEEEVKKDIPIERPELEKLSPAEQAAVKAFAEKIDVLNTEQVMNYGSNAQKNISEFSEAALNSVRTKDLTPRRRKASSVCSKRPHRISRRSRRSMTRQRSTSTR